MRTNIPVERTTENPPNQGHGEIGGESDDEEREHRAQAAGEQDRLPSDAVGETSPEHAGERFREGEGGNEDACVEGCVTHSKVLDHEPGIGKDGGDGNGFG
jgi:hypothetical protein